MWETRSDKRFRPACFSTWAIWAGIIPDNSSRQGEAPVQIDFRSSERSSLGVEVELEIVDLETRELRSGASEVLPLLGRDHPNGEHPKAKHELLESTIEIITGICTTVDEARKDLEGTLAELYPLMEERGMGLMCSGTHPFSDWARQEISPSPRYAQLIEDMQWMARRLQIFGIHVHVGVRSPEKAVAMVNLDMIGRLREKLDVQGTGTSAAWTPLLDSLTADAATPELARVPDGFGPSDHASFYGRQIPVLALFTGAHDEYHRPADDLETIDPQGEVRVLELAARIVEAVADGRAIPYAEAPVTQRRAMAFKVGLGVIPDYGYAEGGLLLASVRPDGPAAAAGLQAGDVIIELAGREVADVYVYTEILAGLEAGVPIDAVVRRGEEMLTVTVTPTER